MQAGTKALQELLTDILANAKTRERELPAKVRLVREAIAEDRGFDFDPPEKAAPGDYGGQCSHDATILIDRMGRAVSFVSISLSAAKKPVKVRVRLTVWRDAVWVAAVDDGEALDVESEFDALCSQFSQAVQKAIRKAAHDMMVDRTRHESGPGWE